MNKNDLVYFRCLSCGNDLDAVCFEPDRIRADRIREGAVFCPSCMTVYPVTGYVPFFLDSGYCGDFDFTSFSLKWKDKFDFSSYKLLAGRLNRQKLGQANFYNEDSSCYDDLVLNSNFWKACDSNTLGRWMTEIPRDKPVLDIGCGTGRCAIQLAKRGHKVIATDISIGMLKKAVEKSDKMGANSVTYFLADAEKLPLRQNAFSTVISFGLLHHVDDPLGIIKCVSKCLEENGTFYALENNASPLRPIFVLMMKFWKLWNEEAGRHPVFKLEEMRKMISRGGLRAKLRTSVFLPPHFLNIMSYKWAERALFFTDRFFSFIPFLKNAGGQLEIKAVKAGQKK